MTNEVREHYQGWGIINQIRLMLDDDEDGAGYLFHEMPHFVDELERLLRRQALAPKAVDVEILKHEACQYLCERAGENEGRCNECDDCDKSDLLINGLIREGHLVEQGHIIQEGYVAVPIEPTEEMEQAAYRSNADVVDIYKAMIKAAKESEG